MKLFTDIKALYQVRGNETAAVMGRAMNDLPLIEKAWLAERDGIIIGFGPMNALVLDDYRGFELIDASEKLMLPCWVDSHTHAVFAGWRNQEFEDRIQGLSYQEIAARGGGILNSARALAETTEDVLFLAAYDRIMALIRMGTGAIEIKSGYGLTLDAELKMLRVIRRLKTALPIPVKSTFLGAHAFPTDYKDNPGGYVELIIAKMLPAIHAEGLMDYIDAFCEDGYFSVAQTEQILGAAAALGYRAKVHVNQFNAIGGVSACVKHNALSVDHLEVLNPDDVAALQQGNTIPVALPSCSFFLGIPYAPAREMMEADLPLVLASDFNPGSTPSGNMNFVFSLACIKMKMTPAEAVNAMTLNAAAALEILDEVGSISIGKRANLILTKNIPGLSYLPYAFGSNHIEQVYIGGLPMIN